jgi:ABC-type glycerol-3-phosphate transport system substrate-binding protein
MSGRLPVRALKLGFSAEISIVLILSLSFSGCSKNVSGQSTLRQGFESMSGKSRGEPVVIKWYWSEGGNIRVPEDSYICRKILEDLNIKYVHIAPKGNDFTANLDLLLASQDIPDIMESYPDQTTRFIDNKVIIPVEKYLTNEYLANVIKISSNWDKAVKILKRPDGHIWGVPCTSNTNILEVPWIRYDWLKNLGLEVPKTFDELRNVLIRFTRDDPDRNGKNDTMGTILPNGWAEGYDLNFGCAAGSWYRDADGNVAMGMFLPGAKDFLKYVKSLVDSGACDREIATTAPNQLVEKIKSGKVGFAFVWGETSWVDEIRKVQPDADWRPMPPPTGVYDKGYLPCSNIIREHYIISSRCKNLDAVFKLMNYMAEDFSTPEKLDYSGKYWEISYGERDVHWDIINGKFDRGNLNADIMERNRIDNWTGRCRRWRNKYDIIAQRSGMRDDEKRDAETIDTYPLASAIPPDDPLGYIMTEGVDFPLEVAEFRENYINNKWPEFFFRAVLGREDIDTGWTGFVSDAEENGYREVQSIVSSILNECGLLK